MRSPVETLYRHALASSINHSIEKMPKGWTRKSSTNHTGFSDTCYAMTKLGKQMEFSKVETINADNNWTTRIAIDGTDIREASIHVQQGMEHSDPTIEAVYPLFEQGMIDDISTRGLHLAACTLRRAVRINQHT